MYLVTLHHRSLSLRLSQPIKAAVNWQRPGFNSATNRWGQGPKRGNEHKNHMGGKEEESKSDKNRRVVLSVSASDCVEKNGISKIMKKNSNETVQNAFYFASNNVLAALILMSVLQPARPSIGPVMRWAGGGRAAGIDSWHSCRFPPAPASVHQLREVQAVYNDQPPPVNWFTLLTLGTPLKPRLESQGNEGTSDPCSVRYSSQCCKMADG